MMVRRWDEILDNPVEFLQVSSSITQGYARSTIKYITSTITAIHVYRTELPPVDFTTFILHAGTDLKHTPISYN
jgi:hypothetical protein